MCYTKYSDKILIHSRWLSHVLSSIIIGFLLFPILFFLTGCAQPFSDLQSARLVGKGKYEATPSISSVHFVDDGEAEHLQNNFGLHMAYGVNDRYDLRLRIEHIRTVGDSVYTVNVLGFGPKIQISKGTTALNLPIGMAFGDDINTSESWEFHPTLLFTILHRDNFEINTSAKVLVPLSGDSDTLIAFNLGTGFGPDLNKWAIRPELGFLLNPGENGFFMHFSIGFTIYP